MGKVIPIAEATRVVAGDAILTFIDECYDKLAKNVPGFIVRDGQKYLSREVCKALVAGEPLAAEAPTGTGKTIAYLIGLIAASEKLRTTKQIPIVVATATVGLQTQILQGDLPALVKAGILNSEREAALAKGRGRYFCIQSAERVTGAKASDGQFDFFDETTNGNVVMMESVNKLLAKWQDQSWNGDVDALQGTTPEHWREVAASAETCLAHKCEHHNNCPFFKARFAMSDARIIVANHDLVLADLAMAQEGIDPLFPGGHYLVAFDEAHHLPDKAIDAGSASLDLETLTQDLSKLNGFGRAFQRSGDILRLLDKAKLSPADFDIAPLVNGLNALKAEARRIEMEPESNQFRFPGGELSDGVMMAAEMALSHARTISQSVQDATRELKKTPLPEKQPELKKPISDLLYQCAFFGSQLSSVVKGLTLFTANQRAVRWIACPSPERTLVCVSPLEGSDVLRRLLWGSERATAVMVSATLQDFDGFERFRARVGVGEVMRTMKLDPIFPYHENTLNVVNMKYSPRQDEREKYIEELSTILPNFLNPDEGSLILFPSRTMMNRVMPALHQRFGTSILMQGQMGIKELILRHRARIDEGQGSILCGLATLAEGLDLPGAYCVHVVICALPFAVPTSPVEQELAEVLGRDYFAQRALPDTLVKLVQMVGRLMRRESDRGRITVFDRRLIYTKWGKRMLEALPNFRKKSTPPHRPSVVA